MASNKSIQDQLLRSLSQPQVDATTLNKSLRLLAKWRSALIQNTLVQEQGIIVLDGPFKGMEFLPQSSEGCHVPKLLGCYEQPLQPYIETAIQHGYPTVINIGCAEGYYAVGMSRRMPDTRVLAFDTNPAAQQVCENLSEKNGVQNRISVGVLFSPADFAAYAEKGVLVLCDIEGAEKKLLDPITSPSLVGMDLIVESHECLVPGITRTLIDRFSMSHDITLVQDDGQRQLGNTPDWFKNLTNLDQLLAVWEWRSGPTPWLAMRAKK